MAIKEGWSGRVYEDFEVGDIYPHPLGRTVTQTDNIWFTLLTVNPNPIHFDAHFAAQTDFGRPLVDSTFTLALVTGLSVSDISQNGVNLGWDEVKLPAPVYEGDTIYAQSELLSKRESKSHPQRGIIQVKTLGYNQDGIVVISFKRAIMVYKRGFVPSNPRPELKS
ncbi:MAG: MaoC family dehydratase [Candidatus Promineifilaceae bacterium]|nr:MaoC family dehydratase [Candidatus Promineifilaceae bacterium]